MFSGIIEATSRVTSLKQHNLILSCKIERPPLFNNLKAGDSIAVNGVCLTITKLCSNFLQFDIVPETLCRTNLSTLTTKSFVNLERSIQVSERISGHIVQGHVDTTTKILDISKLGDATLISFATPTHYYSQLVEKGYVALDGISLTLISVNHNIFQVTIIPHTAQHTIAKNYQIGSVVNVETDILGKYILRYMELRHE